MGTIVDIHWRMIEFSSLPQVHRSLDRGLAAFHGKDIGERGRLAHFMKKEPADKRFALEEEESPGIKGPGI